MAEAAEEEHEFTTQYARVVLFGDSITQFGYSVSGKGWCAAVTDHFQRRADIIHRGFSGYNTRWAKSLLPSLVDASNVPDSIVIFFGANDAASNTIQHVPLPEYKDNLVAMCRYLLDLGMPCSSIILVTPPPVHEETWLAFSELNDRSFSTAQTYAHAVTEVARTLGVGAVNVFDAIVERDNWRECLSDGLHLSDHGNTVVGEKVIEMLEGCLKGEPETLVWPEWTCVHPTNYHSQLTRSNL